jgi:hypothetical protein
LDPAPPNSLGLEGIGRDFAKTIIPYFDVIAKMYGVDDVHYEFYQNGQRITKFTNV